MGHSSKKQRFVVPENDLSVSDLVDVEVYVWDSRNMWDSRQDAGIYGTAGKKARPGFFAPRPRRRPHPQRQDLRALLHGRTGTRGRNCRLSDRAGFDMTLQKDHTAVVKARRVSVPATRPFLKVIAGLESFFMSG